MSCFSKFDRTYPLFGLNLLEEHHNSAPQNSPVSAEIRTYEDSPESDATEVPSDWLEQNSPRSSQNSSEVSSVEDMTHCFKSMGNTTVEMSHRPSLASRGSQYGKPKRYVEMYIPRVEQDTDAETSKERLRPHVVVSDCSTDEKADISRNYSSTGEKKIVEGDQEDGIELEYQKNYNWHKCRPQHDPHFMKLEALLSPLKMSPNISELAVAFEPPSPDSSHVSFSPKKSSKQFSSTFKLMKEIYSPQLLMNSSNSPLLTPSGSKTQLKEIKSVQNSQSKVPGSFQTPRQQQPSSELTSLSKISIASLTFFDDLKPSERFDPDAETNAENVISPVATKVIKGRKKVLPDEKMLFLGKSKEKKIQSKQIESNGNADKNARNRLTTITFGSKEPPNEVEFSATTKHFSEPRNTDLDLRRYLRSARAGPDFRTQYLSFTSPKPQIENSNLHTGDRSSTQRSISSSNALSPFKSKRIKSAPVNSRLKLLTKPTNSNSEKVNGELGSLILLPTNEETQQTKKQLFSQEGVCNRLINSARPFRKL